MIIMITGCAGFLGLQFTKLMLHNNHYVYGVDKETYAANDEVRDLISQYPHQFKYTVDDICKLEHLPDVDVIVNFAAETHVDNSIIDSKIFVQTNVLGVQNLLELIRGKRNYEMPRFIQISTDEVYGDTLGTHHRITESHPLNPSNPYAASKAAADFLVQSYGRTYGVKYNIIRPSNCYGPYQYHEKLIPKTIRHLELGRPIPIHGDGMQYRSWLHSFDLANAVNSVIMRGIDRTIYNVPGDRQAVLLIVETIINHYHPNKDYREYCKFDYVRQGIDLWYQVATDNLFQTGWKPVYTSVIDELPNVITHYKGTIRL